VATLKRGRPHGVQVLRDRGDTEICDARTAGVVHKDVCLVGCQYGGKMRVRITYSPEVPMDHIAGVKVAEAPRDVG